MHIGTKYMGSIASKKSFPRGGTMLEVAIALPILALFVLFLLQIIKYFYVTSVLSDAAFQGGHHASTLNLTTVPDISTCGSGSTLASLSAQCQELHRLYEAVSTKTQNVLNGTLGASDRATLVQYTLFDAATYASQGVVLPAGFTSITTPLLILRPGECARSSTGEVIHHPLRPAGPAPSSIGDCATRTSGFPSSLCSETMERFLQRYPLVTSLTSRQVSFVPLPFNSAYPATGSHVFYSKSVPDAPMVNPTSIVTVPSLPTFTATYTPTLTPTPTPTPVPTSTPTPAFRPCNDYSFCTCHYNTGHNCFGASDCPDVAFSQYVNGGPAGIEANWLSSACDNNPAPFNILVCNLQGQCCGGSLTSSGCIQSCNSPSDCPL